MAHQTQMTEHTLCHHKDLCHDTELHVEDRRHFVFQLNFYSIVYQKNLKKESLRNARALCISHAAMPIYLSSCNIILHMRLNCTAATS
jgi:hypothetical protein